MHPVIYDVAVSVDGFISGPCGDISGFAQDGRVVDDYRARLATYAVAIMGRATYEFGYRFDMAPGANPYAPMPTFVFSSALSLPADSAVTVLRTDAVAGLRQIRRDATGPVYLCGGGAFAGALLASGDIDVLRLKRAPVVLGGGIRLFGDAAVVPELRHRETRDYGAGYLFQEFAVGNARGQPVAS